MENMTRPLQSRTRTVVDIVAGIIHAKFWLGISPEVVPAISMNKNYFGINIASAEDPACDDFIIQELEDLGVEHVRLSFSYESMGNHGKRLLDRVLAEGYTVMLDIFPPRDQAEILIESIDAQASWQDFVKVVLSHYHDKVAIFEIGSTSNRKSWSGFSLDTYLQAWDIAYPLVEDYGARIAGPNVSDFEPFYNMAYLKQMRNTLSLPTIHTDNLFVERVIEPEAYDHRVLGRWAKNILRLNLIKKARIIDSIGRHFGCEQTFCTYNCWTIKRLSRRHVEPEQKQADYLTRYLVLAIASGALDRVYWGALICNRDGLIDCGADNESYPEIDNVAYYHKVRGEIKNFRRRPAFYALQNIIEQLDNTTLIQGINDENGISHYIFLNNFQEEIHISWCRDGYALPISQLYPKGLTDVTYYNVGVRLIDAEPKCITEQPLFIQFSRGMTAERPSPSQIKRLPNLFHNNVSARTSPDMIFYPFCEDEWQGAMMINKDILPEDAIRELQPEILEQAEVLQVLRDKRNKIWNISSEYGPLCIKLNRTVGVKRYTYRFQESKAKRHWNNATTMLVRGVSTPEPIAFFERKINSGVENSYYVSEFITGTFSAREIFTSIHKGEQECHGLLNSLLLDEIGKFICNMHNQGVLHRDLSSGNLFFTHKESVLQPYLIDIGRAKILVKVSDRQRLIDLMRINYKLPWSGREELMSCYQSVLGRKLKGWRWAVRYYQFKQSFKKLVKGKWK